MTRHLITHRERDGSMLMDVAASVDVWKDVLTPIEFPIPESRDLRPMAANLLAGE